MDISKIESFIKVGPFKVPAEKPYLYQNFFAREKKTGETTRISWLRLEHDGFLPFDVVYDKQGMRVEYKERITASDQLETLALPLFPGVRLHFDIT